MPDAKQVGVGVAFLIVVLIFVLAVTRPWQDMIKRKIAKPATNARPAARRLPRATAAPQSPRQNAQQQQKQQQSVRYNMPPMITSPSEPVPTLQLPPFPPMPQLPTPTFPTMMPTTMLPATTTTFEQQAPATNTVYQAPQTLASNVLTAPQEQKPEETVQSNHRAELLRGSSAGRTKTATPTTAALMMASINTREENGKTSEGSTALMERLTGRSVSQAERDFLNGKDAETVPEPYRP